MNCHSPLKYHTIGDCSVAEKPISSMVSIIDAIVICSSVNTTVAVRSSTLVVTEWIPVKSFKALSMLDVQWSQLISGMLNVTVFIESSRLKYIHTCNKKGISKTLNRFTVLRNLDHHCAHDTAGKYR